MKAEKVAKKIVKKRVPKKVPKKKAAAKKKSPKKAVAKKTSLRGGKRVLPKRAESGDALRARAAEIVRRLRRTYPDARCALHHRNALELLVATILSAQCTDERVNIVTKDLFKKYSKAEDYVRALPGELEEDIRSTGFFRAKAKSIRGCCRALAEKYGGKVPPYLKELTPLPGIGRKTANVVLGEVYGIPGIVVDTHVHRLANRLGLTRNQDPVKIEFDLMPLIPEKDWTFFSHAMIFHGRRVCKALKPNCPGCVLNDICPSAQL